MKQQSNILTLRLTVVIEPDGPGRFHAFCPGLKGLHVDGATEREALDNASVAACAYVSSLVTHGDPLPIGPHFTAEREVEEIPQIPPGALLRDIDVQWPSAEECGNR
jgi:predicted RNase H-like HicB family nuclease